MTQGRPITVLTCLIIAAVIILAFAVLAWADVKTGRASWYSRESCKREGTGGKDIRMANGKPLDDNALTCAAWGPKFGTMLRVTNLDNGKSVVVKLTDRGPGKRAWRRGVIVDLTKAAFRKLAPVKRGVIRVKVETVKGK